MTWLGVVSYGIYLYHQPIADALGGGINSGGDATVRFLWLAAATAALAIGVAALSYYLVERPALKFKERRLVGGLAPGRPAPPAPRPTPPPPASPPASANPSPAAHERHT